MQRKSSSKSTKFLQPSPGTCSAWCSLSKTAFQIDHQCVTFVLLETDLISVTMPSLSFERSLMKAAIRASTPEIPLKYIYTFIHA